MPREPGSGGMVLSWYAEQMERSRSSDTKNKFGVLPRKAACCAARNCSPWVRFCVEEADDVLTVGFGRPPHGGMIGLLIGFAL